jgi:Periplasmic binding protein
VNGRKIDYKYALDDGGNPSQFTQLASDLVNQDHVFAVTGVASLFFSPNIVVESKTPTYGCNVTANWAGPPNLFAAGGSVQYLPSIAPQVAYVARAAKATKIGMVAYGVAASAAACQAADKGLTAAGYNVAYTNFKVAYPETTVATDVQRMKEAGVNFVLTCMEVQGNINMARAIQQYGLKTSQLWLNGNDQSTLNQNVSLMQGVYFYTAHVPFTAPTSLYPGLKLYLTEMIKYEPQYTLDEVAIQGWESAALFVAQSSGQEPDPGQRHCPDKQAHFIHGRRFDRSGELESHRAHRTCAALLRGIHSSPGEQVRAGAQQGEERLQLLRVDRSQERTGDAVAVRHPNAT